VGHLGVISQAASQDMRTNLSPVGEGEHHGEIASIVF
jgi:hypothetical protein